MRSASRIVDSRWAITKLVRFDAQRGHRLLDQHLGAGVDRAGRLVEDQDRRVGEERPGDGEQLLLAGADVAALVVDHRVVAVGQRVHEAVDVGRPRRLEDLLLGGVEVAVGDVVADRAAEQPGVLQHHADARRAGRARVIVGDVDAVEGDPAAVELVEPHDQVDERGLAGAGRADDGDRLARLGDERQVLDQRLVRVVARTRRARTRPGPCGSRSSTGVGRRRAPARRRRAARRPARPRRPRTAARWPSRPPG